MRKLFYSLLLTIAIVSCKKDDVVKSTTELLMNKTWVWSDGYAIPGYKDSNGVYNTHYYKLFFTKCLDDDDVKFETQGAGIIDYGAMKCGFEDTTFNYNKFKWSLSSDNSTLIVSDSNWFGSSNLKIKEISDSKFVVIWTKQFDTLRVYTDTYTLK